MNNKAGPRIDSTTPTSFYCSPKSYHYIPFAQRRFQLQSAKFKRQTGNKDASSKDSPVLSASSKAAFANTNQSNRPVNLQFRNNQSQLPNQQLSKKLINLPESKIRPQTLKLVYNNDGKKMQEILDQFKSEILDDIIQCGVYTDSVIQDCISRNVMENSTLPMANLLEAVTGLLRDIGIFSIEMNEMTWMASSEPTGDGLLDYEDEEFESDEGESLSMIRSVENLVIIAYCYLPLKNTESGEFGLKDKYGMPCLLLKFSAQLYNFNLNGTNIAAKVPELTSPEVKLSGYCGGSDDTNNSKVEFKASWKKEGRRKQLILSFGTAYVEDPVNHLKMLRWQLKMVTYSESYSRQSVEFSSKEVMMSAPLKQKFICHDKLNLTLTNRHFKDYILELNPEISAQPYQVTGKHPNLFICGSTRRRTLAKSFESRMTIFSGIVLCITSISLIVGYSFRRQSHPTRKKLYESLT
ncbi:Uncharacterized protein BM_BM1949 [Brugia malayi]|uniref:Uncharacterized protein n=1 Tax=Brugia malayi TaxID=6279 RepID=A0A4E9FVV6_BRUMA|nr:Uncharacterized protein BM_BM1949 [Brugia malayi]VIO98733.1 Uncharacterized protein BM_BM1949 [Brugia malayi]